jgi:ABC-type multidrug transport system fused ATPase/permease subunit
VKKSALDPIKELHIYQLIHKLAKNKNSMFITHRIGSVKFVDNILVFKNGELNSSGNFNYLLKNSTEFKTIYNKQKNLYKNKI